jgi:hypothetical protein
VNLARPAFLKLGYWSPKRTAILIGFTLSALSTLGPQFYVSPIEDMSAQADQNAKALGARIDMLRSAQSQYLLFEQMGVLIYALNAKGMAAEGSNQHDTLFDLYQLSLLDRTGPVRQMIGELARVNQLDYRKTADAYAALVATARKSVSFESYKAVDDFENTMMEKSNALMGELQRGLLAAEGAKSSFDGTASRRRLHMLLLTALGTTLLLAANLLSEKPAEPAPPAPETDAEAAAVDRLVKLALAEAKALPQERSAEPAAEAKKD